MTTTAQPTTRYTTRKTGPQCWYVWDTVKNDSPTWVNFRTKREAQAQADARNSKTR